MLAKPTIHPLARQHLRELRERWKVEPTLEETLWIVQLCDRVLNPVSGERGDLIGIPVRCGSSDEWLWPITVGASIWYQDLACTWWADNAERLFWALGFALAHARDKEVLVAQRTREAATGLIYAWSLSLACTRAELEDAVDRILPSDTVKPDAKAVMDWGRLVADIESASGLAADHWIWSVSRAHTVRAWYAARQNIAASGGRSFSSAPGPEDQAVMDLARAKSSIVKAHAEVSHD